MRGEVSREEISREEISNFEEKDFDLNDFEDVTEKEKDIGNQEYENIEEVQKPTPGIVQHVSFSGTGPITLSVVLLPLLIKCCYSSL